MNTEARQKNSSYAQQLQVVSFVKNNHHLPAIEKPSL
jgi:hypothetical protein